MSPFFRMDEVMSPSSASKDSLHHPLNLALIFNLGKAPGDITPSLGLCLPGVAVRAITVPYFFQKSKSSRKPLIFNGLRNVFFARLDS